MVVAFSEILEALWGAKNSIRIGGDDPAAYFRPGLREQVLTDAGVGGFVFVWQGCAIAHHGGVWRPTGLHRQND